ncbi:MAG: 30S ribosomal protein S17 [Gammaproteobacteria bacterium]
METANKRKTLTGKVVSKSSKTIKVVVERHVKHPVYKKIVTKFTKVLAHDEHEKAQINDIVYIGETKPISKRKSWELIEVNPK